MTRRCHRRQGRGFTLTELAIVLVIVALLIGGMLVPLSVQREIQSAGETQKQLAEIKEALLGFAAANGRLPCPAAPNTTGVEAPSGGVCSSAWDGFLPAISLSLQPTDEQGYALDGWNNRIRYAVTIANASAFTIVDGIKTKWTASPALAPDLRVCNTATGITGVGANAVCGAGATLSDTAAAVIFSTGKNGQAAPAGADELANGVASNDRAFVAAVPSASFDDLVVWISPNILYSRLLAAGRLP